MELVRRDEVNPAPPAPVGTTLEPYRVLFPIGVVAAIAGLVPWIAFAVGSAPWWPFGMMAAYPSALHSALLAQGFELAFVCGFLLTAMPAFTHGPRCTRGELTTVTAALGAYLPMRALDSPLAPLALLAAMGATAFAVLRRVRPGAAAPPEEYRLVATGAALGLAGAIVQALAGFGVLPAWAQQAGVRCFSLGMVPALVLGLGGLLVPTFTGMRDPLRIVGVAPAGDRPRRRAFALGIAALLVLAVNLEFMGRATPAAWLRAVAALASTQLAWKLWRAPGRRDRLSWVIWSAGWCVAIGFTLAALLPQRRIEAWHIAFIGGYALLTLGIGTRVVVSHGGHAHSEERAVLGGAVVALLVLAGLVRVAGPWADPAHLGLHHMLAALLAVTALSLWLARAWPRVRHTRRALVQIAR